MALSDASAYATIAVSDLDRARAFYEGTLGFSVVRERPDGVLYQGGGGTQFFIYPSQFAGTSQSTSMGFDVADFDREMQDLRDKGVTFEEYDLPGLKTEGGVAELEGLKGAWFKDPDGNILAIAEMMASSG